MNVLLVAALAMPFAGSIVERVVRPRAAGTGSWSARAAALSALVAAFPLVTAMGGDRAAGSVSLGWQPLGGFAVDRVGALLLVLVLGISAVVQTFAVRYLYGEPTADRFFLAAGMLTTSTAGMVTATTLLGLAICWSLAGAALCLALATYGALPAARLGLRRTIAAFVIGDLALWSAVLAGSLAWGTVTLRGPLPAGSHRTVTTIAGCLLVVAALARSAQLPFHRWLPATLAAPTPVSALLHAGVVNAGGVLLVRTGGWAGSSTLATYLAFTAGGAGAVYGTALMLAKPDVKGALAYSTMGQMGFMVAVCGLGAYPAAVFHLVAHAMYKATLFLGSGGAVGKQVRHRKAPPMSIPAPRTRAIAAAAVWVGAPIAVLAAAAVVGTSGTSSSAAAALLTFACACAAAALHGWLRRHPGVRSAAVALCATFVAALGYLGLVHLMTRWLAVSIPVATSAASAWLLAPLVAALAGVAVISSPLALRRRWERWREHFYVTVLVAGYVHPPCKVPATGSVPARPAWAVPSQLKGELVR